MTIRVCVRVARRCLPRNPETVSVVSGIIRGVVVTEHADRLDFTGLRVDPANLVLVGRSHLGVCLGGGAVSQRLGGCGHEPHQEGGVIGGWGGECALPTQALASVIRIRNGRGGCGRRPGLTTILGSRVFVADTGEAVDIIKLPLQQDAAVVVAVAVVAVVLLPRRL